METPGPVLVVGEALVDVVRAGPSERELPGGSAANAAVALARLGASVRLGTALAPDQRGEALRAHLEGERIGWAWDPVSLGETSVAEATVGADGSASYRFRIIWRLEPPPVDLEPPAVVLVSSLGPVLEPGAQVVRGLLDRWAGRAAIVYDVNARPGITGTGPAVVAAVEATAGRAALVKASDEDLAALWPRLDEEGAARHLLAAGAGAVVVTRGSEGARWYDAERTLDQPAVATSVVDTIGAGDTFGAALLWTLLSAGVLSRPLAEAPEAAVRRALRRAASAAAWVVSRPGADPPTGADLDRAEAIGQPRPS